jgi:hypothetical protein
MKLISIETNPDRGLTAGKLYEVFEGCWENWPTGDSKAPLVKIRTDRGEKIRFYVWRFTPADIETRYNELMQNERSTTN